MYWTSSLLAITTFTLLSIAKVSGECSLDARINTIRCSSINSVSLLKRSIETILNEAKIDRILINFCQIEDIDSQLINASIRELIIINSELANLSMSSLINLESSLNKLDLSNNRLKSIPDVVLALTNLASVDLSSNGIPELPPGSGFNNWNALIELNLASNKLGKRSSPLSLLEFNLEPLTDTLEKLDLSNNGLKALPDQLVRRQFARLRVLQLQGNPLTELPLEAFSGMQQLEVLDLSHSNLANLRLVRDTFPNLRHLVINDLPMRCDCDIGWIVDIVNDGDNELSVDTPLCATPFRLRNRRFSSLNDEDVCPSSSGLVPHFYRISLKDEYYLPQLDFQTLKLKSVKNTFSSLRVTWTVKKSFYTNQKYDWALISRVIGQSYNGSVFFKTKYDLNYHLATKNKDWSPENEDFEVNLDDLEPDNFYEICLAALDPLAFVYYVHRDNCRERRTSISATTSTTSSLQSQLTSSSTLKSLNMTATKDSIVMTWVPKDDANYLRVINCREFGNESASTHRVFDNASNASNGSHSFVLEMLAANKAYHVCMESFGLKKHHNERHCHELYTKKEESTSVRTVAAATVVSSSTTAFFVIIIFCCCCPKSSQKDLHKEENETNADESLKKENKDKMKQYDVISSTTSTLSSNNTSNNTSNNDVPAWWRHTWLGPLPSYHFDKELYLPKRPVTKKSNEDSNDESNGEDETRLESLGGLPLSALAPSLPRPRSFRHTNSVNMALMVNNGRRRSSLFATVPNRMELESANNNTRLRRDSVKRHTWSNNNNHRGDLRLKFKIDQNNPNNKKVRLEEMQF